MTSLTDLQAILTTDRVLAIARALVILAAGIVVARLVSAGLARVLATRVSAQQAMLARRTVFYVMLGLIVTSTLHQLGFRLSVLLGAAGILTVALGFASQTSASNLISGLFLVAERPFVVGDTIRIGDLTGEVLSIDLLSTKLRTFDNLYVRVPNESIIKSQITNLTYFPIRRLDLVIGVAYKEDIRRVGAILLEVADRNPWCLDEPKPMFKFKGFGDSALDTELSVWTKRENFLEFRTRILDEIKEALDRHGVEIPFPHVSVYTGSLTEAFPVRLEGRPDAETPARPATP